MMMTTNGLHNRPHSGQRQYSIWLLWRDGRL